ncbi:class I SAM-dependent methyltransferase [Nocardioides phosphati]|nr:methyltransferase domain-containing protein [Nocardioides phosphati]
MSGDTAFTGGVPELYERLLVPMIFAAPARLLAQAVLAEAPQRVLETAAGTGVLTRELLAAPGLEVVATDLNPPMLAAAQARMPDGASATVRWEVADALALPFADSEFDVVACQFGAMFFPDKVRGYAEALRVLRPGGRFVFNVWDTVATNPVPGVVSDAVSAARPGESLDFIRRTPHGYADRERITAELVEAGFAEVEVGLHQAPSRTTAAEAAVAFCQGTPLRAHIEASSLDLAEATELARVAVEERWGEGPFEAPIGWLQVTARVPA